MVADRDVDSRSPDRLDAQPGPSLHREVLPPLKAHSGLAVMLVASAAMLFAVAASAFALRVSAADCPYRQAAPKEQPAPAPVHVDRRTADGCQPPATQRDGDREVLVFQVCPQQQPVVVLTDDGI